MYSVHRGRAARVELVRPEVRSETEERDDRNDGCELRLYSPKVVRGDWDEGRTWVPLPLRSPVVCVGSKTSCLYFTGHLRNDLVDRCSRHHPSLPLVPRVVLVSCRSLPVVVGDRLRRGTTVGGVPTGGQGRAHDPQGWDGTPGRDPGYYVRGLGDPSEVILLRDHESFADTRLCGGRLFPQVSFIGSTQSFLNPLSPSTFFWGGSNAVWSGDTKRRRT